MRHDALACTVLLARRPGQLAPVHLQTTGSSLSLSAPLPCIPADGRYIGSSLAGSPPSAWLGLGLGLGLG